MAVNAQNHATNEPASSAFQSPEPDVQRRATLQPHITQSATADIEAEKIARMKELLKKGDAEIPKRSITTTVKPVNGVTGAKFQAAGYVDYDQVSRRQSMRAAPATFTADNVSMDVGGSSSVPAPVQSRVVFEGVSGLGLGLGSGSKQGAGSLELPEIGRR